MVAHEALGRAGISELIAEANGRLSPSERRIAEAVLDDPKIVAFGTVAQLAARSGSSGPSVVRFAGKLGFSGFVDLQDAVQDEIADQLRPATERIRERSPSDVIERVMQAELDNVQTTLGGIDPRVFRDVVELLGDRRHRIWVIASELGGTGHALVTQLDLLRDGVALVAGSPVAVSRQLTAIHAGDVVIAIDVRRYERWVIDATTRAMDRGARVIAVTDGVTSPLAAGAEHTFVIAARGVGPFDSAVGAFSLIHALVTALAARLRRNATGRLDSVEASWRHHGDLVTDR
jgi:DNA-binding MurR/RpiR family transcriptional regulator